MQKFYQIRAVEESDFAAIIDLIKEFALFEKRPDKMTNNLERLQKEKDYFNCWVVENDKKDIVGYVAYFISYHTWSGKSLYMDDLYVQEAYRGHGIGSALLDKIIQLAREIECQKVRWQVSDWNQPAQEFYKQLGAEIEGGELICNLYL